MKNQKTYALEVALEKFFNKLGVSIAKFFKYLSTVPKKKADKMDKIAYIIELAIFVQLFVVVILRSRG